MNLNIRIQVKVDTDVDGLTDKWTDRKLDPYISPCLKQTGKKRWTFSNSNTFPDCYPIKSTLLHTPSHTNPFNLPYLHKVLG